MKAARLHSSALVYFDAVRRAGSIREAARNINVASSAVNRQILKLEAEVGLPLFDRLAGGVRLTAAGEALARHVIMVLQDADRFTTDIGQIAGAQSGTVTIAAAEGICTSTLPHVLVRLKQKAPRATVSVSRTGSLDIAEAVLSGEVDLGIAFDVVAPVGLRSLVTAEYVMGAIMRPDHPLAGHPVVPLSACLDYPLIMSEGAISIGQLLAPAFLRLRATPNPAVRSNSIELTREMIELGLGIGFQTRFGLDRALAERRLVHVPLDAGALVISTVSVFARAQRFLPPLVDLCVHLLEQELHRRQDIEAVRELMPKR